MNTKVGIIGTNGLPGNYGGWDPLVKNLVKFLKSRCSFVVYTSSYSAVPGLREYHGAKIKIVKLRANGIQSIPYDILSLVHAALACDVLLLCGTSGCISLPIIRLFKKKIILNPDGLEWKRKKWSRTARRFLRYSEKLGVRYSDIVISDNREIQKYIRNEYGKDSRLIEYGGDQVLMVPLSVHTARKLNIEKQRYGFTVCRIEPENNIGLLLEAFKVTGSLNYVIVGNWNHSHYGRKLRQGYGRYPHIKMLDPIYEQMPLDEIRGNCLFYVHGHSVGGTNPSLVEAMNLGLMIVAFKAAYNVETTEGKAIYFDDEQSLVKILYELEGNRIELKDYQHAMKEIARRRYRWEIIAEKYLQLFCR
jgi:glycosyltransferase involved in cell wall biosynthesis